MMNDDSQRRILTIKEARKLLGPGSSDCTDQEVLDLVYSLTLIARLYIKSVQNSKE